jgi:hypothetical protein
MTTFGQAHKERASQLKNKSIPGTSIVSRFCNCLSLPPNIKPSTPLTKILGGNLTLWDLGLDLMQYPLFLQDGLLLQKSDVVNAKTVGNLGDLVFKWYINDGWKVT